MWIAAVGGLAGVLWLLPSRMSQVRDVADAGRPVSAPAPERDVPIAVP
jgi:hypothetical protein